MPALYAMGQHMALVQIHSRLRTGEHVFAFLDDIYVICYPERVTEIFDIVQDALRRHADIKVNLRKTKVWNPAGEKPDGVDHLGRLAWVGEGSPTARGVVVLGTPVGSDEFVQEWIRRKVLDHKTLLDRIPAMQDLQCSWIVLLLCASTRANYILRNLPPDLADTFAQEHDNNVWDCLRA